jgi:hypothetical protein
VLPFIDQANVFNQIDFTKNNVDLWYGAPSNDAVLNGKVWTFVSCPSNPNTGKMTSLDGTQFYCYIRVGAASSQVSVFNGTPSCYAPISGPVGGMLDCTAGATSYCSVPNASPWAPNANAAYAPGIFANGVLSTSIRDITDGTSNTLLFGERRGELSDFAGIWSNRAPTIPTSMKINSPSIVLTGMGSNNGVDQNVGASSFHVGGAHFILADGSVRFLSNNIDFVTYNYLGNRSDSNTIGEF